MAEIKPQRAAVHRFGPYEFVPAELELREGAARKAPTPALNRLLLLFVTSPGELEHILTLVTSNTKDFSGLGLRLMNPWET